MQSIAYAYAAITRLSLISSLTSINNFSNVCIIRYDISCAIFAVAWERMLLIQRNISQQEFTVRELTEVSGIYPARELWAKTRFAMNILKASPFLHCVGEHYLMNVFVQYTPGPEEKYYFIINIITKCLWMLKLHCEFDFF